MYSEAEIHCYYLGISIKKNDLHKMFCIFAVEEVGKSLSFQKIKAKETTLQFAKNI